MSTILSAIRLRFEPLRSLAFGSITGTYAGVGTPFVHPIRLLKVTNLTDENIIVSFDGITDHDVVAANGFFLYDYASNKADQAGVLEQSVGTRLYIKAESALPTLGNLYVTVQYAAHM